jgi:hypothetical protein
VQRLGIWGLVSFCWACFKWFFSAGATMIESAEVACNSFDMFPSLGLKVSCSNPQPRNFGLRY